MRRRKHKAAGRLHTTKAVFVVLREAAPPPCARMRIGKQAAAMSEGSRRFPPAWRADKIPGGYVVRDANGQALAARSTRDPLNVLAAVTECGAGFRSLKDTWADTTTPHGRLMLTVLGGLAEFERELIRARTGEGHERAMKDGVGLGRPPKMTAHQRREALQRMDAG
jgi:hypothetical protein